MRIALLADIHANRQAFEACMRDLQLRGADRIVILGDLVGYGGDPAWVVDQAMELSAAGAIIVLGNHDLAVSDLRETFTEDADIAMAWTRGQLGPEAREFLASLPMRFEDENRLYVHANVGTYPRWSYVDDASAARRALESSRAQAVFCGHVHIPALYGAMPTGKLVAFRPVSGAPVPLPSHRKWLGVLGSVGQPRDGDPSASYALLDTAPAQITFLRVPYDVEGAVARIRERGLPETLAKRLFKGR
ncbi:MAG: metallophosphoesterase family protein [Acidobacteria bacterium]|nr:metallophosphoesterase family protein [Acidobacteriota bacterium]